MNARQLLISGLAFGVILISHASADLVAHWEFDETSGNLVPDSSGNGHDGTVEGTANWVPAQVGGGLYLDGSTAVSVGAIGEFDSVSVALWFNYESIHADWNSIWHNDGWSGGWLHHMVTAYAGQDIRVQFAVNGAGDQFGVTPIETGIWYHSTVTYDSAAGVMKFYLTTAEEKAVTLDAEVTVGGPAINFTAGQIGAWENNRLSNATFDDMRIYDHVLSEAEIKEVLEGDPALSTNPNPEDEAVDISPQVVLAWEAGEFAQTHNVYFGTDFAEVNEADLNSPVLLSQGQSNTTFAPDGALGQTYYWRVDEVNGPPDSTVFKGNVWSFTAEPVSFAVTSMAVTASSSQAANMGPENTINGVGLNELDQHSIQATDMWLSGIGDPTPIIQYEFGKVLKLHEMWVWNSNQVIESFVGLGAKDVIIETSTDGAEWTVLEGVSQFAQAPGNPAYTANTVIDFGGTVAKFVRITVNSGYGIMPQYGISEVRFLFIPTYARRPKPATGSEGVSPDVALTWRAGREAASHDVYLSTDPDAVLDGSAPSASVTGSSFQPDDLLLNQTHFWRVDEVNEASDPQTWAGDLWSFTTPAFVVVDDFEGYSNDNENFQAIFQTWIDGLGYTAPVEKQGNGSGSIVGYAQSPFAEQDIVHGESGQSMPLEYDNSMQPYYSETERTFDTAQDWTRAGSKALTLFVYGDSDNSSDDPFYVALKDNQGRTATVTYGGDRDLLTEALWHEWNIDLARFGSIDLAQVAGICVGVGDRANPQPGGAGMLYVDDIRLYPSRCVSTHGPEGDVNGDCLVDQADVALVTANWLATPLAVEYTFDSGLADSSGQGRNGVGQNSPSVQNGVLTLNGTDFVDIPLGADNPFDGSRDFSIALDFKTDMPSLLFSSARNAEPDNHSMAIFVHRWDQPYWGEVIYDNFWVGASAAEDDPLDDEWHTVVVTYSAANEWVTVYLDGVPGEGSGMNPAVPDIAADTVRIGGSLNDDFPYRDGVADLDGDIDNVRIFNFALTAEDVYRLPALPRLPADVNGDGIVDQADQDLIEAKLGTEQLWP